MHVGVNPDTSQLGNIVDVQVWPMQSFHDVRGRIFKAYSSADKELFPSPFITFEHFFTESKKNVFRGMHFQGDPHAVSKIVSIVKGKALDFLLDIRKDSETFGVLQLVDLDESFPVSISIPTGVAHGYLALEDQTIISYRMDGAFCGNCDGGFFSNLVSEHLPISLSATIRSARDTELIEFWQYEYQSECSHKG
jgi:dTDP-4-dehydrorhamnose 3,5-epimerase